jgi:hypothetical protein
MYVSSNVMHTWSISSSPTYLSGFDFRSFDRSTLCQFIVHRLLRRQPPWHPLLSLLARLHFVVSIELSAHNLWLGWDRFVSQVISHQVSGTIVSLIHRVIVTILSNAIVFLGSLSLLQPTNTLKLKEM